MNVVTFLTLAQNKVAVSLRYMAGLLAARKSVGFVEGVQMSCLCDYVSVGGTEL